jgi:3-isopropylmalate/(R)-2-methylmalate dehydratase small subunit
MERVILGKVWKFGDSISTDLMLPGSINYSVSSGRLSPEEAAPYCMSSNRPGWHEAVGAGDILVAGRNFGCGSSRPAYLMLKAVGIQAVVAESISRLFFRTCINGGFPVISCPGVTDLVGEGDRLQIDLDAGIAVNVDTNHQIHFERLPADSPPNQILEAGGLIPFMKGYLNLGVND